MQQQSRLKGLRLERSAVERKEQDQKIGEGRCRVNEVVHVVDLGKVHYAVPREVDR